MRSLETSSSMAPDASSLLSSRICKVPSVRRFLVNGVAVFGPFLAFGSLATWGLRRYLDGTPTNFVEGPGHRPAVGAPVFLDRGDGIIERYVTDSLGRFSFSLNERDR